MTLFWHKIFLLIYSDKDLFHQHKIAAMMAWIKVYVHTFADGCYHSFMFLIQ